MKTNPNDKVHQESQMGDALTKREYFAALIMQGLVVPAIAGGHNTNNADESKGKAIMAVRLADALIAQLNDTN
jgi:hypothetical protein